MKENVIKVEFKEIYMPAPVVRECVNMTKEQVIKMYGLKEKDIQWFRFID